MAKIYEEVVTIRLSKLVKNSVKEDNQLTGKEFFANLETIVQELVGESIIVEIEKEEK